MSDKKPEQPNPIDPANPPYTPHATNEEPKAKMSKAAADKLETETAISNAWNSRAFRPIDITTLDPEDAAERIRTAEKADVLVFWRKLARLRASGKDDHQGLVDQINARLLQVQGPPLTPEE